MVMMQVCIRNGEQTKRQFLEGSTKDGTADLVNLLGPLMLLRSRLHYDAMPGAHVALHHHHTPSRVPIVVAGHCHTVMFTDMIVQREVIRRPEFTEGTEPCHDSVYPVSARLVALLRHFFCV